MSEIAAGRGPDLGHLGDPSSFTAELAAGGPPAAAAPTVPEFDIVPRVGLVLATVVLIGLVVAVASNAIWPLDFFHVVFGAAWTIIDLFVGFVIGPILGSMAVPARIQFTTRFMPKMVVLMPTLVTCTLVGGWQLASKLGTNQTSYHNHGWVVASFIVVGVMAIIALGLLEPANIAVLFELKKKRPNPTVIERLMKRFIYCSGITGAMQVATLVIMTKLAS
jgi:hypothetical protein